MTVGVIADGVSFGDGASKHLRVVLCASTNNEERRRRPCGREHVKHARRPLRIGPVIESQIYGAVRHCVL